MTLPVEFELEADGGPSPRCRSCLASWSTARSDEALANVQGLALHTLADRIEHGEADANTLLLVSFTTSEAA